MKNKLKKLLVVSAAASTFIFNPPVNNFDITPTVYAETKSVQRVPLLDLTQEYTKDKDLDSFKFWENLKESFNSASTVEQQLLNAFFDVKKIFNLIDVAQNTSFEKAYSPEEFENAMKGIEESKKIAQRMLVFKRILDGVTLEGQGKTADAVTAYNQAFGVEPDYTIAYYVRGMLYMVMAKDEVKAVADFNKAVEISPNSSVPYIARSIIFSSLKQYDASISDLDKLLKMYPEDHATYGIRAEVFSAMENYEAAVEELSKAIELNPDSKGILFTLENLYKERGTTYIKLNQYDNAVADYSKRIQINPNDSARYIDRGNVYVQMKAYEKAITDFDKVIEMESERAEIYYQRGKCYEALGQKKKAKADFNKAKKIEDKNAKELRAKIHDKKAKN